jgi:outer membrane protein TolC
VQGAADDVKKANAQLREAYDAYIPSVTAGAGLGQAYGYLPSPPTLFDVTAGSLAFSISQFSYIHSARAGINAAQLSLQDVQEAVAQDTALAFVALAHDQQRDQVVLQKAAYANTLVTIVQDRVDAGQDSQIELTQAKLTAAQLRLEALKAQDDTDNDRDRLARLIGLPPASLQIDGNFPASQVPLDAPATTPGAYANAGVASAFATAEARRKQAEGDSKFRFWPQINFFTQYNRYATFTNSFSTLEQFSNSHIAANEAAFGVQISLPLFDMGHSAKGRVSAAEASHAFHDAQNAEIDALDGQSRLRHSIAELNAQAEVASLEQQLAQQQLDVIHLQLQSGTGNPDAPQMTPKDEQKSRIGERDKYLGVVDAGFQLRQAEIQLLRQTGGLISWLKSIATGPPAQPNSPPGALAPHP